MPLNKASYCIQRLATDINNEPVDDVVKIFTRFLYDKAFDIFGKTTSTCRTGIYTSMEHV